MKIGYARIAAHDQNPDLQIKHRSLDNNMKIDNQSLRFYLFGALGQNTLDVIKSDISRGLCQ
jgi:hypothetical protein